LRESISISSIGAHLPENERGRFQFPAKRLPDIRRDERLLPPRRRAEFSTIRYIFCSGTLSAETVLVKQNAFAVRIGAQQRVSAELATDTQNFAHGFVS
jgi:hypothetical protein